MDIDKNMTLILRALELESPILGEINRMIVELGGVPIHPRPDFLRRAEAEPKRKTAGHQAG